LHTYAALRPLRLLYIDGVSAGKTANGILDSQDCILLAAAAGLCELAAQEREERVDGFVRIEGGFEVVLCEFERRLDVVRIARAREDGDGDGNQGGNEACERDMMQYYKAIAARYDTIGGGRVVLDYEHFVAAYTYPIDLFYFSSKMAVGAPRR